MIDSDDEGELAAARAWIASRSDFFEARRPVLVARAPGRLDVMGGIAGYSGSLVLELPLAVAAWVAVQACDAPELAIETGDGTGGRVTHPLADIVPDPPLRYEEARALLTGDPARAWAATAAGAAVALQRQHGRRMRRGARILVRSDVPAGRGVGSSAALGVAAFEAVAALEDVTVDVGDLALAAQTIRNAIVGAPSRVVDQMTAACGRRGQLLELLCQPAKIVGHVAVPPLLELYGIDSGIRRADAGADYGSVRAAAFMGYRIVAAAAGLPTRVIGFGRVAIDDPPFAGYLANVSPSGWQDYRELVPERMTGDEFLSRFGGSTDAATGIDLSRTYGVRAATEHPILEHERVQQFRAGLADVEHDGGARGRLGALMYESHASYSACGLGSDGADLLVALCREAGPASGIHGARITGGGSGGTVAVLANRGSRATIDAIARRYGRETGRDATVFAGSSSGARAFGVATVEPGT